MAEARIRTARGARACEALLLRDLEPHLEAAASDPRLLGRPLRVIVPSRSLREHLGAVFVRHFGRSVAGVALHTLRGVAEAILERAGVPVSPGEALFPILVRQRAREEPALCSELDQLEDGYGTAVGNIADLLDAGFDPSHTAALEELLDQHGGPPAETGRVRGLLRVAERVAEALAGTGAGRVSAVWQLARACLDRDPERTLPSRAVFIHGFADATGAATDFIEAILRHCGAWIYLDHPSDPAAAADAAVGASFTRRFSERLAGAARLEPTPPDAFDPPLLALLEAPGAHAEVRGVALRIHALLGDGACPERIGVVARDLAAYTIPLRLHLRRLGIPFSGVGTTGPANATGRQVGALLDVLRLRLQAPVDRWVDALCDLALPQHLPPSWRADLRLSLHTLGAARLRDVLQLEVDDLLTPDGDFALPVREGLWTPATGDVEDTGPRAVRRKLPGFVLRQAVHVARALHVVWECWPVRGPASAHFSNLWTMLREHLDWEEDRADLEEVFGPLRGLEREVPEGFALSYDDFILLLAEALSEAGRVPLGGDGGGVQVLDVTAARARTFDHLFLLGVNRDVFPRIVLDDPLWPDPLRRAMSALLPDIPIKETGFDEERYLFAQMLSASPCVTLSWQIVDDDGKAMSPSPLVARLRMAQPDITCERLPAVFAPPDAREPPHPGVPSAPANLRPAHEHALLAGLYGSRADFAAILPVAEGELEHAMPTLEGVASPERRAQSRLAVLAEIDPDLRTEEGRARRLRLGPYHGMVGGVRDEADPRCAPLFITTVERTAGCPWRVFVQHLLRIEPRPDALGALPHVDARLVGSIVHRALERIVREGAPESARQLGQARQRPPRSVSWPDDAELARMLREEAERISREEGHALPGLTEVMIASAAPYLDIARQRDWAAGDRLPGVLGTEITGSIPFAAGDGQARTIYFKADRVDATNNALRLTDYKTGRPVSEGVQEATRTRHLLRDVATGSRLQAVAYALGAGHAAAAGRYLFLTPDISEAARQVTVCATDAEVVERFRLAVATVLRAWEQGVFFPRLAEPGGRTPYEGCGTCDVAEACLQNDSGYRARMLGWFARQQTAGASHERAMLGLWRLRESVEKPGGAPAACD